MRTSEGGGTSAWTELPGQELKHTKATPAWWAGERAAAASAASAAALALKKCVRDPPPLKTAATAAVLKLVPRTNTPTTRTRDVDVEEAELALDGPALHGHGQQVEEHGGGKGHHGPHVDRGRHLQPT